MRTSKRARADRTPRAAGRTDIEKASGCTPTSDTLIPLGHIAGAHAIRGELRMQLFNPLSSTLRAGSVVILRRGADRQPRRVAAARRHKQFLLLTLEGCESMTAAEQLIGCEVCVPEADLPPVAADEVYHYQLVGMTVVTTAGDEIGVVAAVMAVPSNDVCVVRAGGREHLIPFVADIVKHVDHAARRLVIEPVPGLLDL